MKRRWLKRLISAVGIFIALVLVGGIAGYLYLTSNAGGERLRAAVTEGANAQLAGKLEVGSLSLGGETIVLTGIKLYDPEGKLVAEIERVELSASASAAFAGLVDVSKARIVKPRLYLVQ